MFSNIASYVSTIQIHFYPFRKGLALMGLGLRLTPEFFGGSRIDKEKFEKIRDIFADHLPKQAGIIMEKANPQMVASTSSLKNSIISITPKMFDDLPALRGILKHEAFHIKEGHPIHETILSAAVTLSTVLLMRHYFECSFFPSLLGPIVADFFALYILHHFQEKQADDYCLQHATVDELKGIVRSCQFFKATLPESIYSMYNFLPNSPVKREQKFQNALLQHEIIYQPKKEELIPLKEAYLQGLGLPPEPRESEVESKQPEVKPIQEKPSL